jgi:hypothetical protein
MDHCYGPSMAQNSSVGPRCTPMMTVNVERGLPISDPEKQTVRHEQGGSEDLDSSKFPLADER